MHRWMRPQATTAATEGLLSLFIFVVVIVTLTGSLALAVIVVPVGLAGVAAAVVVASRWNPASTAEALEDEDVATEMHLFQQSLSHHNILRFPQRARLLYEEEDSYLPRLHNEEESRVYRSSKSEASD
jgi:hypothetical protein